jgi:hypothetical protein
MVQFFLPTSITALPVFQSNIDGSARLEWKDWRKFSKLPPGGVSVKEDVFIARDLGQTGWTGNTGLTTNVAA